MGAKDNNTMSFELPQRKGILTTSAILSLKDSFAVYSSVPMETRRLILGKRLAKDTALIFATFSYI